jgi:hypothetical protein
MENAISVRPAAHGWAVELDSSGLCETFHSAAEAERAARALGERLAEEGKAAEIRIHLKDGRLAARFLCPHRVLEWV